jgi:hypothetical protein
MTVAYGTASPVTASITVPTTTPVPEGPGRDTADCRTAATPTLVARSRARAFDARRSLMRILRGSAD